ncbi:MAG: hypothetical protein LBM23_00965 [Propionibacteriaceae bacterium]|jgi:hypothetical protein|nr:hypothetical protein [Propionibacteriaceae bacterium]
MHTFHCDQWVFHRGDEPDAWQRGFDDASWQPVRVPHDWSVAEDFSPECSSGTGYLPGGIGWYRTRVPLADLGPLEDRRFRVVFHGVYKRASVWANGYHLGSRPSGYAEFSFDLTEIVGYCPDSEVVLAVRVDHTDISDSRWYNGSGLTREVDVEVTGAVCLAEHGTTTRTVFVESDLARVAIEHLVENHRGDDVTVEVVDDLTPLDGGVSHRFTRSVTIPAGGSAQVEFEEEITQPLLWSAEDPHLYRLTTTLTYDAPSGSGETDTSETIVGLRAAAFDAATGFVVNGRRTVLTGVCLHEDAGCLGTAVPAEVWLRRLLALKQMGCNAIRMAHNPHSPQLYDLCDLVGFYVIDEAFDEWENPKNKWWQGHNVYPPRHEGYAADFPEWHERDLAAMIDAHKNHPSIVAWSIGNEIDYPNDPYASPLFAEMTGNNDANKPAAERMYDPDRPDIRRATSLAKRLSDLVRAQDSTRPVTLAAAFPELSSRTGFLDHIDVAGYNYKEEFYEQDHERFPDLPLLGSENSHGYAQWRQVTDHDYVAGQFLWTGIDYLGEAHGWPIHGSGAGLLTLAGFDKPGFHLRRSWWSHEPVLHLVTRPSSEDAVVGSRLDGAVSRRWDPTTTDKVEVLCFTNCEEFQVTCGGTDVTMTFDDTHGYWRALVNPGDGPVVAEGVKDGQPISDRLEARGPAVALEADVWAAPEPVDHLCASVLGSLGECAQIECRLVDEDGKPADGEALVSAEVTGGRLLGLENGDLADTTPYRDNRRSTMEGRLIAYVECGAATELRLSSEGLPDVVVAVSAR